jgi:hypothetical protein
MTGKEVLDLTRSWAKAESYEYAARIINADMPAEAGRISEKAAAIKAEFAATTRDWYPVVRTEIEDLGRMFARHPEIDGEARAITAHISLLQDYDPDWDGGDPDSNDRAIRVLEALANRLDVSNADVTIWRADLDDYLRPKLAA